MKNLGNLVLLSLTFLLSHSVHSHHAFTAEFDANAPINITGKVVKVEWINPHAWVHVEVEKGPKKTIWMVEGGTPNTLSLIHISEPTRPY